ncbi:type II toxin-antitoxin system Phd/YefM family antitoxin [Lactobacillus sp. ESL0703]|uniref:type II toxin-antitoxin system Phd/YefM family antitoxin n=1 Tax=Lactobacillus sp. ESL0703 TaxID=2983218 RepID=UPI0023F9E8FE|nr:type II toxin-antitoxin system Phd/YefM family antitoxin [Lactobacillus sp. ESL0703]MDF7669335.1 type II toxin-antitoxin system Phd/YefM family antitoxin [Lactobacillus sp. ESL0703]
MMLAKKINVPLTSISDVKKAPMKAFSLSKDNQVPVYVLNNNKKVGVMLDIDQYNKIIDLVEKAGQIVDNAAEEKYQEKIAQRLAKNNEQHLSDEDVLGKDWEQGLEQLSDEWE